MAYPFPIVPIAGSLRWTESYVSLNVPNSESTILTYCTEQWTVAAASGENVSISLRAPFDCKLTLYSRGAERALALWPTLAPFKLGPQPGDPWIDTMHLRPVLIIGIDSADVRGPGLQNSIIEQVIRRRVGGVFGARLSETEENTLFARASEYHTRLLPNRDVLSRPDHVSTTTERPPSFAYNGATGETIRNRLDILSLQARSEFAQLRDVAGPLLVSLGWMWCDYGSDHTLWTPFSRICARGGWSGVPNPVERHARTKSRDPWSFWGDTPRADERRITVSWYRDEIEVMRLVNPPMSSSTTDPVELPSAPFSLNPAHTAAVTAHNRSGGSFATIHVSSPIIENDALTYPPRASGTGALTLPDRDGFWTGLTRLAATRGQPRVTIQIAQERFRLQAAGRLAALDTAADALVGAYKARERFLTAFSPSYRGYRSVDTDPVDRQVRRRDLVLMAQKIDALQAVCDQWRTLTDWEAAQTLRGSTGEVFKELKSQYRIKIRALATASTTLEALVTRELWDEVATLDRNEGYATFFKAIRALRLTDGGKAHVKTLLSGFLKDPASGLNPIVSRTTWATRVVDSQAAQGALLEGLLDLCLVDIESISPSLGDTPASTMEHVALLTQELTSGLAQVAALVGFRSDIRTAIHEAEAQRLNAVLGDAEFSPPPSSTTLTEPPKFAEVFRCTIVLLNTAIACTELSLEPSNADKRDALQISLARLGTEIVRVGSLVTGSREGAAAASAAEKLAHRLPVALGLVWSAYDLHQSVSDTMDEDEDDVFAWKLTGTAAGVVGLGLEVLVLAEVGIVAGPIGVFVGFVLGVLGVIAGQMAERSKDPLVVKLVKLCYMGNFRESDEIKDVDSDYRHMYRRFNAQLSHLNHFWHNLGAIIARRDETTRIDLSSVPRHATVIIQAWTGSIEYWRRELYWFEADNHQSHGWLRQYGSGGTEVVIAQEAGGALHYLTDGFGQRVRFFDLAFDQPSAGSLGIHHARNSDGVMHVYRLNEEIDRAVVSVEMSPPSAGSTSVYRFLSRVGQRMHIHGFLSQMHLFTSTLVTKES